MDERIEEFCARAAEAYGLAIEVHNLPEGTRSAADAAESVGCSVTEIANSVVFAADTIIVAVVRGSARVDTRKLATLRGVHEAHRADPADVEEVVGWPVGGVPPFCHDSAAPVYVDEQVMENETVWVAAGAPTAVFPIAPEKVVEYADAIVADVTE